MVELYKAGQTLEQIGAAYQITRERVRQIIAAVGVTRKDGGQAKSAAEKKAWREAAIKRRRDARAFNSYGCSHDAAIAANQGKPLRERGCLASGYRTQKHNAGRRNIEWRFTFPEWVAVWVVSGRIHERGRVTGDSFVMARFSDAGPYSASNVYITTNRTNVHDYQMKRLGRMPSYAVAA